MTCENCKTMRASVERVANDCEGAGETWAADALRALLPRPCAACGGTRETRTSEPDGLKCRPCETCGGPPKVPPEIAKALDAYRDACRDFALAWSLDTVGAEQEKEVEQKVRNELDAVIAEALRA